ncbi:MAG: CPBP family intramembrane metalloprotease [Coriobacteriia bacterium]|nr:CPBP family intramembrane metalloprotease [Coriobacteriia bacterium]
MVAFILTLQIVAVLVVMAVAFFENAGSIAQFAESNSNLAGEMQQDQFLVFFDKAMDEYIGLGMIIGMICGLCWFFLIRGKRFVTSDIPRVNSKANFGILFILLVGIFAIQALMILLYAVFEPLFNQGGGSLTDTLEEATTSLAITFWGALYIAVIGPICEELVFRGAVMRKLERYGSNFAIIVSSLLFALYHMILFQAVFAFFIGIIFAYAAGRFSLKWAILLHMINNGLAVLSTYANSDVFSGILLLIYGLSLLATIVVILVRLDLFAAQKIAGSPSEPRVYPRAFASPWLIGYLILTGILSVHVIFA